jgi:hypothetical protein
MAQLCVNVDKISQNLWKEATDTYYFDRYCFKCFESLHVLNILYYERELSKLSARLARKGLESNGEAPRTDKNETLGVAAMDDEPKVMERLHQLLDTHGKPEPC